MPSDHEQEHANHSKGNRRQCPVHRGVTSGLPSAGPVSNQPSLDNQVHSRSDCAGKDHDGSRPLYHVDDVAEVHDESPSFWECFTGPALVGGSMFVGFLLGVLATLNRFPQQF